MNEIYGKQEPHCEIYTSNNAEVQTGRNGMGRTFCGGANMIDKVDGKRIGSDCNTYIYSLLIAMQEGWEPPHIDENFYNEIKSNVENYPKHLVGYAGSQLTFGAKWLDSYRRDKKGIRNYSDEARRNILKQSPKLKGIKFYNESYESLNIPDRSIIYCDPPYEGTGGYEKGKKFNHALFWEWCRTKSKEGHIVFISEYKSPSDFKCLWEMEITQRMNNQRESNKKPTEKLFISP